MPGAPAWDPLGAAPFAWDLPEPSPRPQPPAPRPRKPRVGLATLGVATLVVAGSTIAGTWAPWFTIPHVIGLLIAVLAAGLLIGSFTGGGRGLIWLLVPLSVVGFAMLPGLLTPVAFAAEVDPLGRPDLEAPKATKVSPWTVKTNKKVAALGEKIESANRAAAKRAGQDRARKVTWPGSGSPPFQM